MAGSKLYQSFGGRNALSAEHKKEASIGVSSTITFADGNAAEEGKEGGATVGGPVGPSLKAEEVRAPNGSSCIPSSTGTAAIAFVDESLHPLRPTNCTVHMFSFAQRSASQSQAQDPLFLTSKPNGLMLSPYINRSSSAYLSSTVSFIYMHPSWLPNVHAADTRGARVRLRGSPELACDVRPHKNRCAIRSSTEIRTGDESYTTSRVLARCPCRASM